MPKKGYKQTEEHKRKRSDSRKIFSKNQETQICKQYVEDKLSIYELAKIWECMHWAIRNVLIRNDIKLRTNSESHKGEKCFWYGKHFSHSKASKQKISIANSTPENIQQSLKNGFGTKCYYKGEFFPSKFEKDGCIKLKDLGYAVIHNFLSRFDAKVKKGNFEAVMEFHMFYKGKDRNGRTEKQYYNQRRKLLNNYGYKDLKLVVIKDLKEIENKLGDKICKKVF